MPRLIEVDDPAALTGVLTLEVGDMLLVAASGGQVRAGGVAIGSQGAMTRAVVGTNGQVLTPQGPPNAIVFFARGRGRATIEVMTGDPFGAPRRTLIDTVVV